MTEMCRNSDLVEIGVDEFAEVKEAKKVKPIAKKEVVKESK